MGAMGLSRQTADDMGQLVDQAVACVVGPERFDRFEAATAELILADRLERRHDLEMSSTGPNPAERLAS